MSKRHFAKAIFVLVAITLLFVGGAVLVYGAWVSSGQTEQSIVSPTDSGNPQSSEGGDTAVTENDLVKTVASLPETDDSLTHAEPLSFTTVSDPSGMTVLSPGYLPSGMTLQQVATSAGSEEKVLDYVNEAGLSLQIRVGVTIDSEGLPIKEGNVEVVTVEGADSNAQLVRGSWHQLPNGKVVWDREVMALFLFSWEGTAVMFMGFPGSAWSQEELVRIAESMRLSSPRL